MDGLSANQLQGVNMNVIPIVKDLLTFNVLLYDLDNVIGNLIGDLARRSQQKLHRTLHF